MTEAVTEAATEEAVSKEVSENELVALFLAGKNGASGDYTSTDGVLSEGNSPVARTNKDGQVLLSNNALSSIKMNDALVAGLAMTGTKYLRMAGFSRLNNVADRLSDLDNGRHEDFRAAATLFGLEFTQAELESIQMARDFRNRVTTFFTDLHQAELKKIRDEQNRVAKERAAREAITWDDGDGIARNSKVGGAGGGQRLRLRKDASANTDVKKRVDTSTGHVMTYKQAQRAWQFATKYWHGGKSLPSWGAELAARSHSGYRTRVTRDSLNFGCQQVTRKEAERFAAVMGWTQAVKA